MRCNHWLFLGALGLSISIATASAQVVSLPTAQAAIVGRFAAGPIDLPLAVNLSQFQQTFASTNPASYPAEIQAREFFANGGASLYVSRVTDSGTLLDAIAGRATDLSGLNALTPLSDLRVLLVPEISTLSSSSFTSAFAAVRAFAEPRQILFILDPPPGLTSANAMITWINSAVPDNAAFCAVYFPYLQVTLDGASLTITPCGAIAAIFVTNDANYGVWKSPAGTNFPMQATGLTPAITSTDSTNLNTASVNPIRQFAGTGIVPFGARTLDRVNEDTKYIPVVRTLAWVAASLQRSLAFAAVRADNSSLWSDIQSLAASFLQSLYTQGAFPGTTPSQAYYARCDATTTTATDIAAHRTNLIYGMALLQASEFDLTQLTAATADSSRVATVPVLRPRIYAGKLYLPYPTQAGFTYHLQTRPSLTTGTWSDVTVATGDGAWRMPALTVSGTSAFYQLLITPSS